MNTSVPEERLLQRIVEEKRPVQTRDSAKLPPKKNKTPNRSRFWLLALLLAGMGATATLLYVNDLDPCDFFKNLASKPLVAPSPAPVLSAPAEVPLSPKIIVPASKEPKPIPPPEFLILRGILDENQEDKSALVENTQSSQSQNLREGDSLLNYKVASIEKRRVVFTSGEETFTLTL